ncbi:Pentatricopeptide repeat-containing protein -mitochondrial [Striga hermonthica]|uniref:Pentatricopeptide repeat-containing protein -mitochondrial n=1 Tax=Striga hermonthica TaxID=68872 RepID=A0A9N7NPN5_STRHE|nr:Pentatricopeptide repeat-containing protein -mitochondrial [Striga hermonthica]
MAVKNIPKALLKPSHLLSSQPILFSAANTLNCPTLPSYDEIPKIFLTNPSLKLNLLQNPTIYNVQRSYFVDIHPRPPSVCENAEEEQNPDDDDDGDDYAPTKEAQTICKIILEAGNSRNLESALDSANVTKFLCPKLVLEVLKKLNNAGIFALSFFRWAEKKRGFHQTPDCYNALVESLGKIKQFKTVWSLVDEMRSKGILEKDTFALVCRRYARAKRVKEAIDAFEKMESKYGLKPNLHDYNRLLDTLSKSTHVNRAQEVFDKWKNHRFRPNIKSYTILLEGWGRECNFLELDEVRRNMIDDGFGPDVVSYGILIKSHCRAKKFDEAVRLYQEMVEKANIKPTPHIYCTLINAFGPEKRLTEALKFFKLCKESNDCVIEAPTYNSLIGAYCWSEKFDEAYKLINEMKKCGVGPNVRTYGIILHHLVKLRRTREAYGLFKRMCCEPDSSTYEIMVRMFCNERRVDMAIGLLGEMKSRGLLPRMHMFAALIEGLCSGNRLDEAFGYFMEMLDMGIRPPDRLFKELKKCLVKEGKEDVVVVLAHRIGKLKGNVVVG